MNNKFQATVSQNYMTDAIILHRDCLDSADLQENISKAFDLLAAGDPVPYQVEAVGVFVEGNGARWDFLSGEVIEVLSFYRDQPEVLCKYNGEVLKIRPDTRPTLGVPCFRLHIQLNQVQPKGAMSHE